MTKGLKNLEVMFARTLKYMSASYTSSLVMQ